MACCVATIEPNDVTDHVELFTLKRKKKKKTQTELLRGARLVTGVT